MSQPLQSVPNTREVGRVCPIDGRPWQIPYLIFRNARPGLESGKIKGDATFEVSMVPSKLRFCAAMARADYGRSGTPRSDVLSIVLREPIGVAGIIVPWNSPVVLMIRSLAPDSAAGATAVIKMPDCFQRVPTSWCPP